MIKIYLLTGFLGAGKTTLLRSMLESHDNQKTGVIVNEFGGPGIDGRLLEREGMRMVELSNGSIFCACIKDKFVDSLIEMSAAGIDILFIEASGLADPASMGQILEGIRHKTAQSYQMEGSICVVDAVHFLQLADLLPALENQVAYAGAVIINKADMAEEEAIRAIAQKIYRINPGVYCVITSYCQVDFQEITARMTRGAKESGDSTNTVESRPAAFVLKASEDISYGGFISFLKEIAPFSYRVKGFAKTGCGVYEVSTVQADVRLREWEKPVEATELVAISSVGIKLLSLILAASAKHLDGKLEL